jgi:hypothetical protein
MTLSFSYNPFAGAICDACGAVLDPPDGLKIKTLTNHRNKVHDDQSLNGQVQIDKIFRQGSTLAILHHSLETDTLRVEIYTKFWSDEFQRVFWCNEQACNRGFLRKKAHQIHKDHLIEVRALRPSAVSHPKTFLRETHHTMVEMKGLFCISYNKALQNRKVRAAAAANLRGLQRPALNAFRAQAESVVPARVSLRAADTTSANTSLVGFGPSVSTF